MIVYFDTSALVPLLITEPGTPAASSVWRSADRVATVRLTEVEAHAALAQAARLGRLTRAQHRGAKASLVQLLQSLDWVEADADLMAMACEFAETHALRAYDSVHLAAAERLGNQEVVLAAGDGALLAAAHARGMATAATA